MELNDAIFTCCQEDIIVWILRNVMMSGPKQTSNMDIIARIVYGFKQTLITIFVKRSIVDVWRGPELIKCFVIYE